MSWTLVVALIATLVVSSGQPAFANERPLLKEQAAMLADMLLAKDEQARPNARRENRGLGWGLIGGGATVFVLGLVTGGAECTIAQFGPVCENTSNKALMLVGAGLVGAGGVVLFKGRPSPQIVVGPRVLGVRKQVSW